MDGTDTEQEGFEENKNSDEIPNRSTQNKFDCSDEANQRVEKISCGLKDYLEKAKREFGKNNGEKILSVLDQLDVEKMAVLEYAKDTSSWIKDFYLLGMPFKSGNENTVIDDGKGTLYKSNNLYNVKFSVCKLLDQVKAHNVLFPETKYEVVGFTGLDNGARRVPYIEVILQQDKIQDADHATPTEISDFMIALGFKKTTDSAFLNHEYTVLDLYPRNVLKDDNGIIYVIDNIIRNASQ